MHSMEGLSREAHMMQSLIFDESNMFGSRFSGSPRDSTHVSVTHVGWGLPAI